jgi:hypothetical protein
VVNNSDWFLPWCAGFFDGEGSICIALANRRRGSGSHSYCLHVSLSQNIRELLEGVQIQFGGTITFKRKQPRPVWDWTVCGENAAQFLKAIRPFLRRKDKEADVAIEFQTLQADDQLGYISRRERAKSTYARKTELRDHLKQLHTGLHWPSRSSHAASANHIKRRK